MPWTVAADAFSRTCTVTADAADDPLVRTHRTLHTGASLLTQKQTAWITALFARDEHVQVKATWGIHQARVAA